MTVGVGAVCKDGVAIILDTLIVFQQIKETSVDSKISGVVGHMIMTFSGDLDRFRLLEEILGIDVELRALKNDTKYSWDKLIPEVGKWLKRLNQDAFNPCDLLIARHNKAAGNTTDLHYVDNDGNHLQLNYMAIGKGKFEANRDLQGFKHSEMTMSEFTLEALVSILRIERDLPSYGVSIKSMKPEIRWFENGKDWDFAPKNIDALLREAQEKLDLRFPKKRDS